MLCAILLIDGSYLINGVSLGVDYCGEELEVLHRSLVKKLLYLSNSKVQRGKGILSSIWFNTSEEEGHAYCYQ